LTTHEPTELPKQNDESQAKPSRQPAIVLWLKRLGIVGFLFFLAKGLLWLLLPVLVARGCL
jgi:hypothetical protein